MVEFNFLIRFFSLEFGKWFEKKSTVFTCQDFLSESLPLKRQNIERRVSEYDHNRTQ